MTEETPGEKTANDNDEIVNAFFDSEDPEERRGSRPSKETGKSRQPSNLTGALWANRDSFQSDDWEDALSTAEDVRKDHSESYAQEAEHKEDTLQELKREVDEELSQQIDPVIRGLLEVKGRAAEDISEDLQYEKDVNRGSYGEEGQGLLSYVQTHAGEVLDLKGEIATKLKQINRKTEEKQEKEQRVSELEEEKGQARTDAQDEEDDIYAPELDEADMSEDDLVDLVEETESSAEETYDHRIDQLEEQIADLNVDIDDLRERKDERIDERDDHLDLIDEAYDPYAQEVEAFVSTATDAVEQRLKTLEEVAETTIPDVSEEYPQQIADTGEEAASRVKFATALEVAQNAQNVYQSVVSAQEEIERVEDALPEGYRDDEERLERIQTEMDSVAGDYDSFEDRVLDALETADSDYEFHDATEDLSRVLEGIAYAEEE